MTLEEETEEPSPGEPIYCCDGSSPEDVVISGMSGRFPLSDSIDEFQYNLYNKINMVTPTEGRWPAGSAGMPYTDAGILKDMSKFDPGFFGLQNIVASRLDAQQRILLEVCYEAIADAGYSLEDVKGGNIAVHCGVSSDDPRDVISQREYAVGSEMIGYLRCLLANRVTYIFDLRGPSFVIDTGCSSVGYAFDIAVDRIKNGKIDAALVTGCEVCSSPTITSGYLKYGISSKTGQCYPFDEAADGMTRSETIGALFLQRASNARRIYAKVLHSEVNGAGYSAAGISVPNKDVHVRLYEKAYSGCGVSFDEIQYLEAHGTGTPVGDPIEVSGIAEAFCKNRKDPLLIGSTKSNVGHSEGAAAICGLIKSILAMETGIIAPNIKYKTPNPNCPALIDGRIIVVTEPTKLTSKYLPVNSFGLGGSNAHIILKMNTLEQSNEDHDRIPRLVLCSATTEEGVQHMLDYVRKDNVSKGFLNLLHGSAFEPTARKPYRGYIILDDAPLSEIQVVRNKREVWFIMTGMGCQWSGMGCTLMELKVFAESMKRSAKILKPFGIDLFEIIRPESDLLHHRRSITPAFVSICAIQIALIDVLQALGITPDGIIGHSTGELLCAYADGCCTAEETILSAYFRGHVVEEVNLPEGDMAAIGMTWEEAKQACPVGVFPACHNSKDSVTISGYAEPLKDFVNQLKQQETFARVVDAYGYGFHSECVAAAGPGLKAALHGIIKSPKQRSEKWKSTSFHPEQWDSLDAKIADTNYFVHNLISTVHFAEALAYIPKEAIVLEIGPHHLLQSILKRAIGKGASYLGTMKRQEDNLKFMLTTIGKLYSLGLNPKIEKIYPCVKYPVPRGTPNISSHIKWNHSVSWDYPVWKDSRGKTNEVDIKPGEKDRYLLDHYVGGRVLYPAAGYIVSIWETLAKINHKRMDEFPVLIENFKIHRATILNATGTKNLSFSVLPRGGQFQIYDGIDVVASGSIMEHSDPVFSQHCPTRIDEDELNTISGREIYSELRIHDYKYGPAFQGLLKAKIDGSCGLLKWSGKWIPFIDAHLLFFCFLEDIEGMRLPVGALSIKINPSGLLKSAKEQNTEEEYGVPVTYDKFYRCCRSSAIEIIQLRLENAPRRSTRYNPPVLENYHFIPYMQSCAISKEAKDDCSDYIEACNQITKKIALSVGGELHEMLSKPEVLCSTNENAEYPEFSSEDHVLFSILSEVASFDNPGTLSENINQMFQRYIQEIGCDMLYKTLLKEYPLRTLLEVISENSKRKLNIMEISNGCPPILPHVADILKTCLHAKVNLTLLHSQPENLDTEGLHQMNIEVKALESIDSNTDGAEQDVVISSHFFGDSKTFQEHIRKLYSVIDKDGFIMLLCRNTLVAAEAFLCALSNQTIRVLPDVAIENVIAKENLIIVSKKLDSLGNSLYLLRTDTKRHLLSCTVVYVKDGCYSEWVEELKSAMAANQDNDKARVWIIARDSPYNGIVGMVKCLIQEPGGEKVRCIFLVPDGHSENAPDFDPKDPFYADVIRKDLLMNIYKDGSWGSFVHISVNIGPTEGLVDHSFVDCSKPGDLTSLKWIESPIKYNMGYDKREVLINICYSALNFRDVMIATGRISIDAKGPSVKGIGFEFSGLLPDGRRVMGTSLGMSIATTTTTTPELLLDVPDSWSLEEAATVPSVYYTCYYALIDRGRLSKGESILIHSGTGGVGTAAIRIALSLGCKVFVTVGNEEKREYLRRTFPQIKDECIGCSRDISFEKLVMTQTLGEGVDVILNSLADDKLQASTRCLMRHGRFLEIGKYDILMDNSLRLRTFLENKSFEIVALDCLWGDHIQTVTAMKKIHELMADGVRTGVVQPLDRTVFERDEVEKAVRFMGSGKHIGKVLVKIRGEPAKDSKPSILRTVAQKGTYFYKGKAYIVIGGLGGFGIEVAKWLIRNGARNVILTSRYGVRRGYHQLCLQRWKQHDVNVTVSTLNVAKRDEAKKLFEEVLKIRPIGGVFNSAVVLNDSFIENQTAAKFEDTCASKAEAMKHIDELSRAMCPDMDLFVCFSSISCGKGNAGQSNYGYANSVMERICEKRRRDGLHGLAIQWGIIGDVGVVHRHMGDDAMVAGVMAQRLNSCLATLGDFLHHEHPVVCSYVTAKVQRKQTTDNIIEQLARVFGFTDSSQMDMKTPFKEMGIDSILSVELQHVLESEHDVTLSMTQLQEMNVEQLRDLVEAKGKAQTADSSEVKKTKYADISFDLPEHLVPRDGVVLLKESASGPPVFFIHHSLCEMQRITTLVQSVGGAAYGLIFREGMPLENIQALAASYLEELRKLCLTRCFHLVGISSASSLAIEIANTCQNSLNGLPVVQSLTFLDGANHLLNCLGETVSTMEEKEIAYLNDFVLQFVLHLPELRDQIKMQSDLQSRICYIADLMCNETSVKHSRNEIIYAINQYLNVRRLLDEYHPQTKLAKDISVIEATTKLLPNDVALVKSTICKVTSGKITIYRVPAEENFLVQEDSLRKIAEIINNCLEESV